MIEARLLFLYNTVLGNVSLWLSIEFRSEAVYAPISNQTVSLAQCARLQPDPIELRADGLVCNLWDSRRITGCLLTVHHLQKRMKVFLTNLAAIWMYFQFNIVSAYKVWKETIHVHMNSFACTYLTKYLASSTSKLVLCNARR